MIRARPTIERMAGYVPGEQPAPGDRIIKLNTNENPFPPSPKVMEAIRSVDPERLRRYPSPGADAFRQAAGRVLGVAPDMILAGNGSDDILAIAARTFLRPGDVLAYPHPTYSLYPVLADIGELKVAEVAWSGEWELPSEALLAAGARAIFFANPNSPSGTLVEPARIGALAARFSGLVLVDEAYVEFADTNCLDLVRGGAHPNVIVCRTLSKSYSLAGLRFGYVVAAAPLVTQMTKVKDSYNCDAVSVAAAIAAMEDQNYARRTWEHVRAERQRVSEELGRRGFAVAPSQANFVLAAVPGGDAGARYRSLKATGILVRWFDKPGLRDKLRITIGTRAENDTLLAAL